MQNITGLDPSGEYLNICLKEKSVNKNSEFICVCLPLAWAVHAHHAGWLLPLCALHRLIRLCSLSDCGHTEGEGALPHHHCCCSPRVSLLLQHPGSSHLANAQQACILRQCKEQQIFIPLGRASQQKSCGLWWLRWSFRCSLMLTQPVALFVHVKYPVTDKKVLRPVRTLLYLCFYFEI